MIAGPAVSKRLLKASSGVDGLVQFGLIIALAAAFSFLSEDWIVALAIVALWLVWKVVPSGQGPPVLGLALTFQWVQVTAALLYLGLTGRRIPEMDTADYRPMVILGLGCILSLAIGLRVGGNNLYPLKSQRQP